MVLEGVCRNFETIGFGQWDSDVPKSVTLKVSRDFSMIISGAGRSKHGRLFELF
jgi:hypothetical protein